MAAESLGILLTCLNDPCICACVYVRVHGDCFKENCAFLNTNACIVEVWEKKLRKKRKENEKEGKEERKVVR